MVRLWQGSQYWEALSQIKMFILTQQCVPQMCVVCVIAYSCRSDSVQGRRADNTKVILMLCEETTEKHRNPSGNTSVIYPNVLGENWKLKLALRMKRNL